MTPFVYNAECYDIYIGNDVDQKSFSLNIRGRYQQMMTKKIPAEPEQLYNFICRQFSGHNVVVGYEAGPTGFGLYDYLVSRDMPCVMLSPASVRRAANQRVKTNRIDAQKISTMLAEGDFKSVRVPEGPYRELRHLVQTRENYVQDQRVAKQRIKALLLYTGLHTSCRDIDQHWSGVYLSHIKTLACTPAVRFRLDQLLDDLDYARQKLLKITRQLRVFCRVTDDINEHMRNLQTIPGIGLVTAATLLGRIGDPRYMQGQREIASFCGIVPSENSTGEQVNRGRITHLGNRYLRTLLTEAAWVAIRHGTELEQFYHRIAKRNNIKFAKQKAIIAVAHKLTLRIYRVLAERRAYICSLTYLLLDGDRFMERFSLRDDSLLT